MGRPRTMSDVLREAIRESDLPLLTIYKETGVQRGSLSRFLRGERSLRLDVADRLAAYLGLKLVVTKPRAERQNEKKRATKPTE